MLYRARLPMSSRTGAQTQSCGDLQQHDVFIHRDRSKRANPRTAITPGPACEKRRTQPPRHEYVKSTHTFERWQSDMYCVMRPALVCRCDWNRRSSRRAIIADETKCDHTCVRTMVGTNHTLPRAQEQIAAEMRSRTWDSRAYEHPIHKSAD